MGSERATDQLHTWIRECVSDLRDRENFEVIKEEASHLLLLFGLCARTIRYADAYESLVDSGFSPEASPIARAALEHALTAQWVFLREGGLAKFRVASARSHKEHYEKLAAWSDNAELKREIGNIPAIPAGKSMPKFMDVLRDLDQDNYLETQYALLSQSVHVTHSAVFSYLSWNDGYEFKYEQDDPWAFQTTYVVAISCMLASWVIASLTNDMDRLSLLDQVSEELTLPMNLEDALPLLLRRKRPSATGSSDPVHDRSGTVERPH